MTFIVRCPACGREHRLQDEMRGKRVKCPCGQVMAIAGEQPPEPPPGPEDFGLAEFQTASSPAGELPPLQSGSPLDDLSSLDDLSAAELSGAAFPSPVSNFPAQPQGYTGRATPGAYPAPAPQQPQPAQQVPHSDDELLASYMKDDSWKQPDRYSQKSGGSDNTGPYALELGIINSGIIGGVLAIIAGIALFVLPLAFGWFVPYSLVLVVIGAIAICREFFTG